MFKIITKILIFFILLISPDLCFSFTKPVDVVYDSIYNRYLVSDIYGTIDQIDSNGVVSAFATVSSARIEALWIYYDTLFVTAHDLAAISLETGQELYNLVIPWQIGLRDMAQDTSGNLYINDLFAHLIYQLKLSDHSTSVISADFDSANGVCFDAENNRLVIVQRLTNSPITAINLADSSYTTLRGAVGELNIPNGIVQDNGGNYYVSLGPSGRILRYDKFFSKRPVVYASGLAYPVYIFYCKEKEELAIPEFYGFRVTFLPVHGPDIWDFDLTDGSSGDHDGTPEAGETGEFYFTLINTRLDSLKNIRVSLSIDDASICLINRTIQMDDIAIGDSSKNQSNPFLFSIPDGYVPRTDSFLVEISYQYRGKSVTDTIRTEQNVGHISVLLVDDDNGGNADVKYEDYFINKRIPYSILNSSEISSADILSPYGIVVWFTGAYRANPLDTAKIAHLQTYLDNGGKLFLTGPGIAPQLNSQGRLEFLNNYLHCDYQSAAAANLLNGTSDGQIFTLADTIAATLTSPDHIIAANGGIGELAYNGLTTLGAVSYSGTYKMVYFAFNFDGIRDDVPRRIKKDSVLNAILNFFGYNTPGLLMTLAVAPGDAMHLVSHSPEIGWNYRVSDYSQQSYHLQIGTDNDWSISEMWDYGPISGSETSVIYGGSELQDGQTYSFRLQVSDGITTSAWQYGAMRLNTPPTVPTELVPNNLQTFTAVTPDLSCLNATDNEADVKTYSFEVYDDDALTVLVANADNWPEGISGTTVWKISPALAINNDYFWRVRVGDGLEFSPWSEAASFMIEPDWICGDADASGAVNILDVSFVVSYLYKGGPPPNPTSKADVDHSGAVNILDVGYTISYLYKGGPAPNCP